MPIDTTTVRELVTVLKLVSETSQGLRDMRKTERRVKKHQENLTKTVVRSSRKRTRALIDMGEFEKTLLMRNRVPSSKMDDLRRGGKAGMATQLTRGLRSTQFNKTFNDRTIRMRRPPRGGRVPRYNNVREAKAIFGKTKNDRTINDRTRLNTTQLGGPGFRAQLVRAKVLADMEQAANRLTAHKKRELNRRGYRHRYKMFRMNLRREMRAEQKAAYMKRRHNAFGMGRRRRGLRGMGGMMLGGAALALPIGVGMLGRSVVQGTADQADRAKVQSDQAGTSAQNIQQLEFVSDIVGTNFEQVVTAMRRMSDNAVDATKGKGQGVDQFAALGLTPQLGGFTDSMDLLEAIMGAREGSGASKVAKTWLDTVFGRSGAKSMGPMLEAGLENFQKLRAEAEAYGLVVSKDLTDASQKWNDEFIHMGGLMKGIRNDLAVDLLPLMTDIAEAMRFWFMANRDVIKQKLHVFMDVVSKSAAVMLKAFDRLNRVVQMMGGWGPVVTGFARSVLLLSGAMMAAGIVFGVQKLANLMAGQTVKTAIVGTIAWTRSILGLGIVTNAAAAPLYLFAAAIAAALLVYEDLMTAVRGGESTLGKYLLFGTGENVIQDKGSALAAAAVATGNPLLAAGLMWMDRPINEQTPAQVNNSSTSKTVINNPQNVANTKAANASSSAWRGIE
tara:strand:+ start:1642 stop:3657 length:2016 start_codon:yes stop_codon:yes gene_type:complete